jgi:hypothetical protein
VPLWASFTTHDQDSNILNCSPDDGVTWPRNVPLKLGGYVQSSRTAPSLAVFENKLWLAYTSNVLNGRILLTATGDGQEWELLKGPNQVPKSAPSLAIFNNQPWPGFVANKNTNDVLLCSSTDGQNWPNQIAMQSDAYGPSLAVFNNRLWAAFIYPGAGNEIFVRSSSDGVQWSDPIPTNQYSSHGGTGVSLAAFNSALWLGFIGTDQSDPVLVCSSSDGTGWTPYTRLREASYGTPSLVTVHHRSRHSGPQRQQSGINPHD